MGLNSSRTSPTLWLLITTSILLALYASSINAIPYFRVDVGRASIEDNSERDSDKSGGVIKFSVFDAAWGGARFNARGTATLRVNFGDDQRTSMTLSDVSIHVTEFDLVRTDVYILMESYRLGLPQALQFDTFLVLSGDAENDNSSNIYNRLRGKFSYSNPKLGTFIMGEADALATPGESFLDIERRATPVALPDIFNADWGMQNVQPPDARLILNEATAEIIPRVSEPSEILLFALALGLAALSRRFSGAHAAQTHQDAA